MTLTRSAPLKRSKPGDPCPICGIGRVKLNAQTCGRKCGHQFKVREGTDRAANTPEIRQKAWAARRAKGWTNPLKGRTHRPLEVRFWEKVQKSDGCWIWTGAKFGAGGYGNIRANGLMEPAHRVSYELSVGPVPEGMFICHHCDNPPCVRPDHLFLGTKADNSQDAARKRRTGSVRHPERYPQGENRPNAKLTSATAHEAKRLLSEGVSQSKVAQRFGVTRGAIRSMVRGNSWRHVQL